MQIKKYKFYIGIDSGTNTGLCVYDRYGKHIRQLVTVKIHTAMDVVRYWHSTNPGQVFIRVEDARKATFGRQNDYHKAQGAGAVKRDAKIWEDFLTDLGVDFEMVRADPKRTKWTSDFFKKVTGYQGASSEHSRDAAAMVYGK
jgi:hypothetical protein